MQNSVISTQFNNFPVLFTNDAFINATQIAKQFGKLPKDFLKSEQTKEYISVLAQNLSVRRKILTEENQLVIVKQGGKLQGTWLHPKLAIFFARWLSAEFAVWCDEQIDNILKSVLQPQIISTKPSIPLKPISFPRLGNGAHPQGKQEFYNYKVMDIMREKGNAPIRQLLLQLKEFDYDTRAIETEYQAIRSLVYKFHYAAHCIQGITESEPHIEVLHW